MIGGLVGSGGLTASQSSGAGQENRINTDTGSQFGSVNLFPPSGTPGGVQWSAVVTIAASAVVITCILKR